MAGEKGRTPQGESLGICRAGWKTQLFELQQLSDRVNVVLES